jgi:hypothetical protein
VRRVDDEDIRAAVTGELRLLEPAVRGSAAEVEALLHPEFFEFGASGRHWDRASMVAALLSGEITDDAAPDVTELAGVRLADDLIQVTYVSRRAGSTAVRRSSLWRRLDGQWQVYFHQGTRLT